jgi:hypothetical protein
MVPPELHKVEQPAIEMVLQRVRKDEGKDKKPNKQVILFNRMMKAIPPSVQMITKHSMYDRLAIK